MADVETSIVINRPAEEIFDHWADGRLYNDWQPAAIKKDVRLLTPEPVGAGSRFRGTFKGPGELEYRLAEYERPRRLTMVNDASMGEMRHTIRCEPVDGGTRVIQEGEARFKGPYRLLRPLLLAIFRRSFRENDAALKGYLEGQTRRGVVTRRGEA